MPINPQGFPKQVWEVNREIGAVFKGLDVIPGEIERIFLGYLRNWLNRTVSNDEREKIKDTSCRSYSKEWRSTDNMVHEAIENAIIKAGLQSGNKEMNRKLAQMAIPIIVEMLKHLPENRHFRILDIGAGDGDTTIALLSNLPWGLEHLAKRMHIYTLEPGWKKIQPLGEKLERFEFRPEWTPIGSTFEMEMEGRADGWFDMAISTAVLHHMSDPSYLSLLSRKLSDDGVVVIGDWYTNIWSHPALLIPTIEAFGASPQKIRRYENFFGLRAKSCEELEATFTEQEQKANEQMRDYLVNLREELRLLSKSSQLRLLEGHQSLADHMENTRSVGIETKNGILSERHPGFGGRKTNIINIVEGSNIASVWAGGKIRQAS